MASACGCESESLREGAGEIIVEGPWGPEKQAGRGRREIGSDTITRSQESTMIVGAAQKAAMIPQPPPVSIRGISHPAYPPPFPKHTQNKKFPPPPSTGRRGREERENGAESPRQVSWS